MDKKDYEQIWEDTLSSIKVSVSGAIFSTWFAQTKLKSLEKKDKRYFVEIGCKSTFVKATIESRYYGLIQDSLTKALGETCEITFVVDSTAQVKKEKKKKKKKDTTPTLFDTEESEEDVKQKLMEARIRPGFTFDNFAVSGSNQMAYAAAEAVAGRPGEAYNPLFVYGGVGVGKTHLMNAIGHKLIQARANVKLIFVTGEQFTNDIVEGIRNKSTQSFRNKYRSTDALFIDDIQFIAGKDAVQEEFFHTFNAIVGAGGQIILNSDRPPGEIAKLEERLRSRFEAGLIVDIASPDFELRCAICQIKSKERGIILADELVHLIAANIETARKLEGFLVRLASEAKLKNMEIDESLIKSLFGRGEEKEQKTKRVNPDEVISAVSDHYSVGKRALLGKSRARPVSLPRQVLMYILRTDIGLPLQEVGRLVGGRDHTTVMHAVDKIADLAKESVEIREDISGIKSIL